MRTKPPSKRIEIQRLAEIEWNFQQVPDEQTWPCHDWEFARTVVLESNPDYSHEGVTYPAKYHEYDKPWPHCPFMELDSAYRETLSEHYHSYEGLLPVDPKHFFQNTQGTESEGISGNMVGRVALFEIDWMASDKNLRDSFDKWLKQNRPPEVNQQEVRGRGSPIAQWKEDLEALGIYRIIQFHSQLSISSLIDKFSDVISIKDKRTKEMEKRPIALRFRDDEAAWSRSKARAIQVLKAFR